MAPHIEETVAVLHPLGQRLITAGLLTDDQLDLSLREAERLQTFLGEAIANLGFVSQEVLTTFFAQDTRTEVVDLKTFLPDPEALHLVSYDMAKRHRLLPLKREGHRLTIAMVDTYDVVAVDTIERLTGLLVEVAAAPSQATMEAIEREYMQNLSLNHIVDEVMKHGSDVVSEEFGAEAPMIRLCKQVIALAIRKGVTDIHVESQEKVLRVRMRVDGVLRQEVNRSKPP